MPEKIDLIGIDGGGRLALDETQFQKIVDNSDIILGSKRQLDLVKSRISANQSKLVEWGSNKVSFLNSIRSQNKSVAILASGDPGYFGIARLIYDNFPSADIRIHPLPSSISLAFARIGINWEDCLVLSAHGRPYSNVLMELVDAIDLGDKITKLAVLCSPDHPPKFISQILLEAGSTFDRYFVASSLGHKDESVQELQLKTISSSEFESLSIFIALRNNASRTISISNKSNLEDETTEFLHRRGMYTKDEVREVILSKLLPHLTAKNSCLWDMGAGSGSLGITAGRRKTDLKVVLVDKDPISMRISRLNSQDLKDIEFVCAEIGKDPISNLPIPDAVFIGGGGIRALHAVNDCTPAGTFVVASYASVNRAIESADILGNLMQVSLPKGQKIKDGTWRLAGENPVFLTWGYTQ